MRLIALSALFTMFLLSAQAQTIVRPDDDSTFVSEFLDGDEWAYTCIEGTPVGACCKTVKTDYGKFYQVVLTLRNTGEKAFLFDPDSITAMVSDEQHLTKDVKVYSDKAFQKKMRNYQMWEAALLGLSSGITATVQTTTPYQTIYSTVTGYDAAGATTNYLLLDQKYKQDIAAARQNYLRKSTLHPGKGFGGYVFLKRTSGQALVVTVPVNGRNYYFRWDIGKQKKSKKRQPLTAEPY